MIQTIKTLCATALLAALFPIFAFGQTSRSADPYQCDQLEPQTVYMVSQLLRGPSAEQVMLIHGTAAGVSEAAAAKRFSAEATHRYPGYAPISTLVTAMSSAPALKVTARCGPTT